MTNSIRVGLTYSFRGETFSPSTVIQLDKLAAYGEAPNWYAKLAAATGLDTYSYAYEVMRESELMFSEPSGLAVPYLDGARFDFDGFMRAYRDAAHIPSLQAIARNILGIEDLNSEPKIREALVQAYRLGKHSESQGSPEQIPPVS